ncbi:MAG: F0F1 ATP synthase subunit A [Spirochaetia bacterium]|nr:F0F1 ATP synthase subunit A [Spirochaetia bacterium]
MKQMTIAALLFSAAVPASLYAEEHGEHATTDGYSEFNLNKILVHHLMDAPIIEWNPGGVKVRPGSKEYSDPQYVRRYSFHDEQGEYKWSGGLPLHITKRVAMMFIVAFIMCVTMIGAARLIARNPFQIAGRFSGIVESLVHYIRAEVVDSNMHHERGFLPYILTTFFFILFSNVLGLFPPFGEMAHMAVSHFSAPHVAAHGAEHEIPKIMLFWPGITITGDIAVTFTLAVITTALIWITGFRYQGIKYLLSCMPSGMPVGMYWLFLLLFPLELVIGPLAKGFALMVRLLANMTAGHVIIIALLGFIFQFHKIWLIPVSVTGAGAIYMLEVLVAFLQAYIFTLLTALFIGSSMHSH